MMMPAVPPAKRRAGVHKQAERAAHLRWLETAVDVGQVLIWRVLKVKRKCFCEAFSVVCKNDAR